LTPFVLAHWFMDDGYMNKGFYFCTESFTLEEHILLVDALTSKFGLNVSYHKYGKDGYR
jgi:hypothetical protein